MNPILRLNGFKFAHLTKWQSWWMFYATLLTFFGINGTLNCWMIGTPDGKEYLTVSDSKEVLDVLWHQGYRVSVVGRIFWAYVLRYQIDQVPEPLQN